MNSSRVAVTDRHLDSTSFWRMDLWRGTGSGGLGVLAWAKSAATKEHAKQKEPSWIVLGNAPLIVDWLESHPPE